MKFERVMRSISIDETDHADHRRGIHRAAGILIVERDVAAGDGSAELVARLGHSARRLAKLEVHLGAAWIAEV